jgi:pimeloyl-ACP methyl ester carboxylesterase
MNEDAPDPAQPIVASVRTGALEIAYQQFGPPDGAPVVLLHGFPDDVHAYASVAPALARQGCRVLVPWLRGYGATSFLDAAALRSGQQAALGADLRDFLDALGIERAALAGYDWGGRAACIVAALWPERVRCLVSVTGYNIQNIAAALLPGPPDIEHRMWYIWYFNTPRGRAGLLQNRNGIARLLWRLWSPNWRFSEATFARTAASFDNADFVDVVIHSYRHRHMAAEGDPALDAIEAQLAGQPAIPVPTIVLHGAADGVHPPSLQDSGAGQFTGPYLRRIIPVAGHFLPNEAPGAMIEALGDLLGRTG